jgi:ABC-type sugar transport system ATPase subunit
VTVDAQSSTAAATPIVEIRGLRKEYPGVLAVDDASLTIAPGEILALLGKNGAGKSTVIKMLAGSVTPDAGEIRVEGEEVQIHSPRDAGELKLGFVHQELTDAPDLTVAENVSLGQGFPKRAGVFVDWPRLRSFAAEVLGRLNADIDPRATVRELSVADQRLVMIAHALAKEVRLLVLDEPTGALTEPEIDRLMEVVRTLSDHGVAILYVTHRLEEVFALTDRVVVMRDGQVVGTEQTKALDRPGLVEMIVGPGKARQEGKRRRAVGATRSEEVLLEVDSISREGIVDDVSFAVQSGEILGIAGLVGAGRTELVRLIYGADPRSDGKVMVSGKEVRVKSPEDALKHGLVMIPEDRRNQGAVLDFNVRENVTLATLSKHRAVRGLPFPRASSEEKAARQEIEALSISTPSTSTSMRLLSGGNQQKAILARWMEHGAKVFIFDEPTLGIDVDGKQAIYEIMEKLAGEGCGIIFVSSEFAELPEVCDRVLVMSEGRVVKEFDGETIEERTLVEACYAAREEEPLALDG